MVNREAPVAPVRGALHTVPSCLSVALPVLLWSTCLLAAAPHQEEKGDAGEVLRVEVGPEGTLARPIRIGLGLSTTLLFDADIQQDQVSLEGRAQFARVSTGNALLVLVPSRELRLGETLKVSIPYKDASVPARLVLTLQVKDEAVDRQVEVYRRSRSAESYRQEAEQLRVELERLRQGDKRELATVPDRLDGFRGFVLGTGPVTVITVSSSIHRVPCEQPCPLSIEKSVRYRAGSRRAIHFELRLTEGLPWIVGRTVLLDGKGHAWEGLTPWQSAPAASEANAKVTVEFEVNTPSMPGIYSLKIWDAAGTRSALFTNMAFE
ncbi:DUF2381 family protein [Corallococcus praedator]|uniref:DUF2381 family protein n=1 Tax=Corallococcus praedator TaxID=2316724 RepID=A0ABX9QCQ3_9BACT|nr:DUF2381 family protein [Corallococcus sp. CA031C]RKI02374.1 DUF2381 family protein [Corallococcus praedator]